VTDLLQRVEKNIQDRRLLDRGRKILVAVSGGLDSMVLLHALRVLSARHRWRLLVAHFNHQLRGRSSDADEQLVRRTAAALKLPVVVGNADVKRFAKNSGLSIEMAARRLRHEFFARAVRKRKIRVVALAHHADDQVELFFLRLLRGAGGEGLAGMKWRSPSPADAGIMLVRPLLDVTKEELLEFARKNRVRFREDATNAALDMPRNRLRNELLPLLRKKYQPGLTKTVLRLMELVGAEADWVGETAQQWLASKRKIERAHCHKPRSGFRQKAVNFSGERPGEGTFFDDLPVAVQRRVLQLQLGKLGVPVDFDLVEQLRASANRFVSVGSALSVSRDATGTVKLRAQPAAGFNTNELGLDLAGGAGGVNFDGVQVRWHFDAAKRFSRPRKQTGRELFDADKIGGQITLRHWRPGDRCQPIGLPSAVKLQDWFTNRKIPRAQRHELTVAVAENGEIFWVAGLRISENFKLTLRTRRRLVWRWQRLAGFSKTACRP
jgi:tRNA(Ile)-lysidine synthase